MYTTDAKKMQTCWRCRKCHALTPLGEDTCSNPSCQADLSLYGEPFTPAAPQEPVREEVTPAPSRYDTAQPSSSNLWEENTEKREENKKPAAENRPAPKPSHSEKKVLKKQQAEARAQEAAARRSLYNRGPVKEFFLSVLVILVSLVVGFLSGGIMMMSFTVWGDLFYVKLGQIYYPRVLLWHQILPGLLLILVSAIFTLTALKEKADRKLMFTVIGFWAVPFVISCWRGFRHNGGDSYEMLSVYLFFLFNLEPILVGSAFAGVKGLNKASSILRWIGILILVLTGVLAVLLTMDTYFRIL